MVTGHNLWEYFDSPVRDGGTPFRPKEEPKAPTPHF